MVVSKCDWFTLKQALMCAFPPTKRSPVMMWDSEITPFTERSRVEKGLLVFFVLNNPAVWICYAAVMKMYIITSKWDVEPESTTVLALSCKYICFCFVKSLHSFWKPEYCNLNNPISSTRFSDNIKFPSRLHLWPLQPFFQFTRAVKLQQLLARLDTYWCTWTSFFTLYLDRLLFSVSLFG